MRLRTASGKACFGVIGDVKPPWVAIGVAGGRHKRIIVGLELAPRLHLLNGQSGLARVAQAGEDDGVAPVGYAAAMYQYEALLHDLVAHDLLNQEVL